jgi:hypothetical protein
MRMEVYQHWDFLPWFLIQILPMFLKPQMIS